MRYWLMKSEPDVFSLADLEKKGTSLWDGVRNFQARNFMMKDMQPGDQILFYHSSTEPPGVAGLAAVCGPAEPDPSQFNRKSAYFEPKASADKPIWFCVRVQFKKKFPSFVTLADLRLRKGLKDMLVLRRGQRLSIQPVTAQEFKTVCEMGGL